MISLLVKLAEGRVTTREGETRRIIKDDENLRNVYLLLASLDQFIKQLNEKYPETITTIRTVSFKTTLSK